MHNNIVRNNPAGGIQVAYGSPPADNTQVYDNTVYDNIPGSGIEVFPGVTNTLVANNHVYGNQRGIIDWGGIGTVLSDNAADDNTW
jgi:parallel beta-helix repeat protein